MSIRSFRCSLPALLIVALFIPQPDVFAAGNSHTNPAAIGEPVISVVEIGVVAASNYDVIITLLETLRGAEALGRFKATNATTPAAREGYEYLLARVRFELRGRAVSDKGVFDLGGSPFQWVANSADLWAYEGITLTPPKPALQGPIKAGETREGWLAFAVEQSEAQPILIFDPASGGATGRGNMLFFKLY